MMPGNHDCAKYAQIDLENFLKVSLLESAMLLLWRKVCRERPRLQCRLQLFLIAIFWFYPQLLTTVSTIW